jgi:O-antigen/teichoic acid export membrane protein
LSLLFRMPLVRCLYPRYVSLHLAGRREELLDLRHRGVVGVALIVVATAVLFVAMANEFVMLLFGCEHRSAVLPFQIDTVILSTAWRSTGRCCRRLLIRAASSSSPRWSWPAIWRSPCV